MNRLRFVTILALMLPGALFGQELTPDQEARIAEVFADLDEPGGPGAQVAVIRNGTIIYSRGFGNAQIEYEIPVTPETVFHVASVSKQFTAASVLLLEADGELSIEEDIRTYMPSVPDMGGTITARHLLQHTSGVRDQWELLAMAGWRLDDVITKEHVRRMLANQRELNFPPGSEYLYSNMGYSMAADLVAEVSGQEFRDFAAERIFEPLGMTNTHVHDDHRHIVPNRAYSYQPDGEGFRKSVLSYANHGATSLFTTAEDLVTWLDNFRTHTVGSAELFEKMHTRAVLTDGDTTVYALGLQAGVYRGQNTVGHGGSDAGFRSFVIWYDELATGIAVLTNVTNGNPTPRSRQVGHIVLEDEIGPLEEEEPEDEAEEEDVEAIEAADVDREVLRSYEGSFRTAMGIVRFQMRGPTLWVVAPETVRLVPISETELMSSDREGRAVFHTVDSVTVSNNDGMRLVGTRIAVPEGVALDAFVGSYYSPEIETIYDIRRGANGLVAHQVRHGDLPLIARGGDLFNGNRFFLRELRFTRDESGAVDGFRLTGGRVRNLRFVKIPGGLPR